MQQHKAFMTVIMKNVKEKYYRYILLNCIG